MPRMESLAEAGQNETFGLLQRSFLFGAYTAANYLTPEGSVPPTVGASMQESGKRKTITSLRGEYYGRAHPRENFLMLPDIVKSVMSDRPATRCH